MQQEASSRYSEKEQQLQDQLKDTQKKLSDLRTGADSKTGQVVLTAEQSKEIEGFQAQLLKTRAQLRDVQRSLKEGINRLQAQVQFLDIALVPLLIAIVAIVVGFMRLRYRRQAV
jgi:predicted nuclease with TOPRIM domain